VYRASGRPYDVVPLAQPERRFVEHALLARRSRLNDLGAALGVEIIPSAALPSGERTQLANAPLELYAPEPLRWPAAPHDARVAVYTGQGVDAAASGEIMFALRSGGLSPIALGEDDLRAAEFRGAQAIVFGDGAAREIVDGWDMTAPTRKAPWQPAAAPNGIGRAGVDAIAQFAREGGRVVVIGRSAGLVAPGLVSVALSPARPGIGQIRLRITAGGRWLAAGMPLESDAARAFLSAPPGGPRDADGGYMLRPEAAADAAAWFDGVVDVPEEQSFADTAPLQASAHHAAIVSTVVGRGRVTIFAFSPVFRAQWRSTFPLLFNAIGPPTEKTGSGVVFSRPRAKTTPDPVFEATSTPRHDAAAIAARRSRRAVDR
jgi:hypothetical protein